MNTNRLFKHFLERIITVPDMHARWLNTLSLLEHIGSRKIVKSMNSTTMPPMMLRHIAEEARHAYIFKALALKVCPEVCQSFEEENLYCGTQSRRYFQALDHGVNDKISTITKDPLANYLAVTWLIERRAGEIYPLYQHILKDYKPKLSLSGVINDEELHLQEMEEELEKRKISKDQLKPLIDIENALFQAWETVLFEELDS